MLNKGKIFLTVLVIAFFLSAAASAAAVTVDFHGKAAVGVLSSSNSFLLGGKDDDRTTFGAGKFRFRSEIGTDDGRAKMVYGFETGSNNFGDEWKYSGDSQDFENRFAYVQLNLPGLNDRVQGKAGLQKTGINHWVWTETAPGVTLHGKGRFKWSAGWFRGLEQGWDQDDDVRNATDLYTIKGSFKPRENLTVGAFGVYALDFEAKKTYESGADQYWAGLTGELDGPVFAEADLIYQGGDAGNDGNKDVSAYLANLNLGTHVTDRVKLTLKGLYVSGDDDPNDDDQEAFQSIDADVAVGQIFFKDGLAAGLDRFVDDMFGTTMPDGLRNNGLATGALEGEIQLDAKNNLRGAVRYLQTAEETSKQNVDYPGEDELGTELDLWYSYKYNQNLTLKLESACLFPGDLAEKMFEDDNTAYQLATGMVFSF